jgi:3-methyl-2-oxobutanoate hydroxymethyltransferase
VSATPSDATRPVTTATIRGLKETRRPIVMVTAYDFPSALLADKAGADMILVGDSLGMTVLGFDSTLPVTLEQMLHHTAAVTRGAKRALVVGDMPFLTYQVTAEEALRNAGRFIAEAGAAAVKVEGGVEIAPTVRRIVDAGIPVMGHVGLTPQSVHALGGYRVQGKDVGAALRLLADCRALEHAGAFAVVLECIPAELAAIATRALSIPTIGIGAGASCDGQVQVLNDLLGMGDFTPRHAKRYAEIGEAISFAIAQYADEVRTGQFPGEEQATRMDADVLREVEEAVTAAGAAAGATTGTPASTHQPGDVERAEFEAAKARPAEGEWW